MTSVVLPIFNERESLTILHEELSRAFQGKSVEFIFVDDGSGDRSIEVIRELAARDHRVKALRFRRNFGKAAALSAGFAEAKGEVVMTLDADLQDDPSEIDRFLAAIAGGLDVVSGWKKTRHDPWHKVGPSRIFNWTVSRLTGCKLHDHNCGFKAYRREVVQEVEIYGELHRFIPALAFARGYRVGELEVNHRARKFGKSKYGVSRLVKGFLDLLTVRFLTRFGQRPLHVLGSIGLMMLLIGGLGMVWLALTWLRQQIGTPAPLREPIGNRPLLVYSATLLGVGTQMLTLGVLAELITAYNLRPRDTYSVAERIDPPAIQESPDVV